MPVPPSEYLTLIEQAIPFNKFLGIKLDRMDDGFVRLVLPFRPEFICDPFRPALHGGVISTLIDVCGGMAVWTKITLEDRVSTIDLRVDYLAPAAAEPIACDAQVVRVGNRVAVIDARCTQPSAPDKIVATGKAVYNIKRKDD